jgi:hypothetical protein
VALNRFLDHHRFEVVSAMYLGCIVSIAGDAVSVEATKSAYDINCNPLKSILNDSQITSRIAAIFLTSHRPFEYAANKFRFQLMRWLSARAVAKPDLFVFGNYFQLDRHNLNSCLNLMFRTDRNASVCLEASDYPKQHMKIESLPLFPKDLDFTYVDIADMHCGYEKSKCRWEHEGVPFMLDWNHLTVTFLTFLIGDTLVNARGDQSGNMAHYFRKDVAASR